MEKQFSFNVGQKVTCDMVSDTYYGGNKTKVYTVHRQLPLSPYDYEIITEDGNTYPVYESELKAYVSEQKEVPTKKPYVLMEITYRVHDYFKANCVGKENAKHANDIAKEFGVTERAFRAIRANHNDPQSGFHHLILSCNDGYFMASAPTPQELNEQYLDTAYRLIHHAVSEIKEAKALIKQTKLNGTMRLKLTPYMKELVEIGELWEETK